MMERIPYLSELVHFRNRGFIRCLAAVVVRVHDATHVAVFIFPDVHHGENGGAPTSPSISLEHCATVPHEPAENDSWHFPCDRVE